ncbi:hypothetical protein PV328_010719 [Microctonus aethiopoides]|uniref:BAG domain-containing protein n=1 Tax=Microctonus aethiopoides TaxID=144406 RepID=A0AA39FIF0_9HYME|nr:hypothetical protein PV328_010719 [Microctonus aethiopoides]
MSYYFRDKPRFSEKLRGKMGDELFQELKQHLDDDITFEPSSRSTRDPFERHSNFPRGFPFDDQGFGRLGDIRSQLDNLASRHPEFADHLLGPPWGDVPLHGTLRNKRRGSGSGNSHQGHPDEDARSQASGSSAASAASGASGVSSHGEPEQMYHHHQNIPNNIPQYGLRNTMDIGQHHHNMDNAEKINREQRSASAPPENRQQIKEETDEKRSMPKPQQQPTMSQQQQQQQSNVRHIPIFVEGRDEPVIPKNIDEPTISARQQSPSGFYSTQFDDTPSKFSTPPHFQRPSTFNQHFGNRHRDWSPHFQDSFTDVFDHPSVRRTSQPTQSAPFRQSRQQHHHQQQQPPPQPPSSSSPPQQQFEKRPPHNEYTYCNPQMGQSQSAVPEKQEAPQEQPKRTIFIPKDPLEKVDIIQKEVDSLTEQIKLWNGNSKADKQYIYLDEMLTRELIKLDDIETEGKDNVRQARKNTIKSIQNSISLLESKVTSSAQSTVESQSTDEQQITGQVETKEMENNLPVSEASEQVNKTEAIPLPALPSSPTKESAENIENVEGKQTTATCSNDTMQLVEPQTSQTEVAPAVMEVEQNNSVDIVTPQNTQESNQNQSETVETTDKEETNATSKNGKSPKKLRKTKKQPPISKEPIPLPAAENNCLNVK